MRFCRFLPGDSSASPLYGLLEGDAVSEDALASRLAAIDPLEKRVHLVALRRALAQVSS